MGSLVWPERRVSPSSIRHQPGAKFRFLRVSPFECRYTAASISYLVSEGQALTYKHNSTELCDWKYNKIIAEANGLMSITLSEGDQLSKLVHVRLKPAATAAAPP